jgi:hypothetical protein
MSEPAEDVTAAAAARHSRHRKRPRATDTDYDGPVNQLVAAAAARRQVGVATGVRVRPLLWRIINTPWFAALWTQRNRPASGTGAVVDHVYGILRALLRAVDERAALTDGGGADDADLWDLRFFLLGARPAAPEAAAAVLRTWLEGFRVPRFTDGGRTVAVELPTTPTTTAAAAVDLASLPDRIGWRPTESLLRLRVILTGGGGQPPPGPGLTLFQIMDEESIPLTFDDDTACVRSLYDFHRRFRDWTPSVELLVDDPRWARWEHADVPGRAVGTVAVSGVAGPVPIVVHVWRLADRGPLMRRLCAFVCDHYGVMLSLRNLDRLERAHDTVAATDGDDGPPVGPGFPSLAYQYWHCSLAFLVGASVARMPRDPAPPALPLGTLPSTVARAGRYRCGFHPLYGYVVVYDDGNRNRTQPPLLRDPDRNLPRTAAELIAVVDALPAAERRRLEEEWIGPAYAWRLRDTAVLQAALDRVHDAPSSVDLRLALRRNVLQTSGIKLTPGTLRSGGSDMREHLRRVLAPGDRTAGGDVDGFGTTTEMVVGVDATAAVIPATVRTVVLRSPPWWRCVERLRPDAGEGDAWVPPSSRLPAHLRASLPEPWLVFDRPLLRTVTAHGGGRWSPMWCDVVGPGRVFYPVVVRSDATAAEVLGMWNRDAARVDAFNLLPFGDDFLAPLSLARVLFDGDRNHPVLDRLTARAGTIGRAGTDGDFPGALVVLDDGGAGGCAYRIGVMRGGVVGPFVFRAHGDDADVAQGGLLPLTVAECNLPRKAEDVAAAVRVALSVGGGGAAASFVATPAMLACARAHIDRTFAAAIGDGGVLDRVVVPDGDPVRAAAALALRFHVADAATGPSAFDGFARDPLTAAHRRRLYAFASCMSVMQLIDITGR